MVEPPFSSRRGLANILALRVSVYLDYYLQWQLNTVLTGLPWSNKLCMEKRKMGSLFFQWGLQSS